MEISLVSRASNPQAQLLEVKNENNEVHNEKLIEGEDIMSEEETQEPTFEQRMEEKMARIEEFMNQPVRDIPYEVEAKEEKIMEPERTKEQMHEEVMDLYVDYLKGDISKREYKSAIETKALSSVVVEDGAGLVPERLHNEIVMKMERINKLEQRVTKLIGNGPLNVLDFDFTPTWATHDDGDTISATSIADIIGRSELNPQDYACLAKIPGRLERRSFASIQSLLAEKFAQAYRTLKDDKIMQGTGHKEPLGILPAIDAVSATTNTVTITALANLDYTAMVSVQYLLNEEYRANAVFVAHPDAIKQMRLLTNSANQPVWTNADMQAGRPASFAGVPVLESRAMEDGNASGECAVLFGDLKKYYLLEEKSFSIDVSRDADFSSNQTTLRMVVSFDGMPVDLNAFARIAIA